MANHGDFDYTVPMKAWRWLLIPLFALVISCQEKSGLLSGSVSEKDNGDTAALVETDAGPVSIADLSKNPKDYVGKYLQAGGELSRIPAIQCDTKGRSAPGKWLVSDGEYQIPIASDIQELNRLVTARPQMEVAGLWLEWQGLTGCGSQVQSDRQYYLLVDRIISPNPLALVEVLPESSAFRAGDTSEAPTAGTVEPAAIDLTTLVRPASTSSPGGADIPVPEQEMRTQTPTPGGTPVVTPDETATATTEPEVQDPEGQTATTAAGGEPISGTESTATPTATQDTADSATSSLPIFQLDLPVSTIANGHLLADEVHRWTHEITTTKRLTINVATDQFLDVEISVVAPGGGLVAQQNDVSGKEPEVLREVTLLEPGVYDILISSPSGDAGFYAIMFTDSDSYSYIFQGTLEIGDIERGIIAFESDHFWHFLGTAGQMVSIVATPQDDSDLFFNLFDTNGDSLIRFHDETAAGEPEQIIDYLLPDTGLYSLRIGEYNFQTASYEIYLTE